MDCGYILTIFLLVFSYFLGSIPFGILFTKFSGHGDIRSFGSGNIGATNVLRKAGKFVALCTLLFDAGKGAFAILVAGWFCEDPVALALVGITAVLGHIFPVWLNFKGGKGVATSLAVILTLVPGLGLIMCFVWLLVFGIVRISSVAALVSFSLVPIITYFYTYDPRFVYSFSFLAIVVIFRHKSNIKDLLAN